MWGLPFCSAVLISSEIVKCWNLVRSGKLFAVYFKIVHILKKICYGKNIHFKVIAWFLYVHRPATAVLNDGQSYFIFLHLLNSFYFLKKIRIL